MDIEKWNWTLHKRIAAYFRLYTQILNFSMYMLVSHRNMISVFDMTESSGDAGQDYDCSGRFI